MGGIRTEVMPLDEINADELPEVKLLTVGQKALLLGYLTDGSLDHVAAGYSYAGAAATAWRSKRMQAAVKAVADAQLRGPAVIKAVRTVIELMDAAPGRSDTVRIKAAAWVLDAATLGVKGDSGGLDKKPLAEMTEAELAQFIESQRGVIERDGHAGIINVTPNK